MGDLIHCVDSPKQVACAARRLQDVVREEISPEVVLDIFERWSAALGSSRLTSVPGLAFLRLWLRRGTLEPLLKRELGPSFLKGGWSEDGRSRLRPFPLGVVGHWPAGNIEIQPLLSLSCALLAGNCCLVRIPSGLVDVTRVLLEELEAADAEGRLTRRISMLRFDHSRDDLNDAMAEAVDGAMIWGGGEAVSHLRQLKFPHWARVLVFGPRISAAMMDAETWTDPGARPSWCRRIARDVWQFDQQACSSPQTLFLERSEGSDPLGFINDLKAAFEEESRHHPREQIEPSLTSAICMARASWLLKNEENSAVFPTGPDWTILLGSGSTLPNPTQGRTLSVMLADDLQEVISKFDGTMQTLGLAIADPAREEMLARAAGRTGVDRIVKLGRMHTFGSPWDGTELIRPMVRLVRHVQSQD